jgi:hypothetical protein
MPPSKKYTEGYYGSVTQIHDKAYGLCVFSKSVERPREYYKVVAHAGT